MKQYQQVIEIMRKNNGYATLDFLYNNVDFINWKTQTPFATIRRIVQDERFFFKIKPGLWALKEFEKEILKRFKLIDSDRTTDEMFNHSYFQGTLVKLGNILSYKTYIPNQDKNKKYLDDKLIDIVTLAKIHDFCYKSTLKYAKTIDVIWFNKRKMPSKFIEVEHTTNFERSFIKFSELQDFYADLIIVSDNSRREEFKAKVNQNIFETLKNRIKFLDYESLINWYSKANELYVIKNKIGF